MASSSITGNYSVFEDNLESACKFGRRALGLSVYFHMSSTFGKQAVENPTSTEIQDVCAAVGFNVLLEKNKMYPREWNRDVQYRGRVRIQLKQDDGNPCLPQFPTRKSVMLYAAETIPKLKTRTQKIGSNDQSLQQGEGGKKGKGKKKK
ncbi:signal recognition particle 19 kDa protein isoform X1 [Haliaeetus albicilla]|uniref:signal recognition particle 19 kDa protein isoform X1 n=1 Tax=Haliaeetus albicilla TaxID=8969 RepID=UPI0037E89CD3